MIRAAGVLALLAGLGFGPLAVYGARYFAEHGTVWYFMGFPTYGDGPFERVGIPTTVPVLIGFVVACAAEVVLGVLLLAGWHPAVWLSFLLLPIELAYWLGFALPFGFVFGAARTAVTVAALVGRYQG
jgi:hypothetical protein